MFKIQRNFLRAAILAGACSATAGVAAAAVIPGPTLTQWESGWGVTGLEFTALSNTTLTSFTFENEGAADTVVLADTAGNILHSTDTPAGTPSDTVGVSWTLTAGQSYWLLQTTGSNALFAFGVALPSDSDLSIVFGGVFDYTVAGAVSDSAGFGPTDYWAAFNDITTNGVPEPGAWALMLIGAGAVGASLRGSRRARRAMAAA